MPPAPPTPPAAERPVPVEAFVVDAFTLHGGGGNTAGVVVDAAGLDDRQMQAIAAALAFSETAFVVPDPAVDVAMRFFTPTREIDYCGHATVAAFALLAARGRLRAAELVQGTRAGRLRVRLAADGEVLMNQTLPRFGQELAAAPLAKLLGIDVAAIRATGLPVQIVSTGLADILVPVADEACLARVQPDLAALAAYCREAGAIGAHVFAPAAPGAPYTAACRNFAPLFGIDEESATGSAAGALACYLSRHADPRGERYGERYVFAQGSQMGRASRLSASVERSGGTLAGIVVGGYARLVGTTTLSV